MIPKVLVKAREIADRVRASSPGVPLVRAAKKNAEGTLYLYAPIGASYWQDGISDTDVVKALDELKGVSRLNVRVNSEGGDVFTAKAIENAIRRFEAAEKVCYIDGLAASAATFIALACPKVVTAANATWMIHKAFMVAAGTDDDFIAAAEMIRKENRTIAETYARKTGMSAEKCLDLMAATTWMNASEALAMKFCDEVEVPGEEEPDEDDRAMAAASPVIALAAQTQERLEAFRAARMQMRATRIQDDRASAEVQREGQPERADAANAQ